LILCSFVSFNYATIDTTSITVSGLSSGGYMATQIQVAHSNTISGAAVLAAGPYYCAQANLNNALLNCMNNLGSTNLPALESYARNQASSGGIDALSNLQKHKVFIFSGTQDATVKPSVARDLETNYRNLGVTSITTNFNLVAAHTYPTVNFGNPCTASYTPYISRCGVDITGQALKTLYGDLNPPVTPIDSNFLKLRQADFTSGRTPASLSLGPEAWLYQPTACKNRETVCKLHVAFHGCQQYMVIVGDKYIKNTDFNGWAEANNINVLYPQAITSFAPSNPNGCWDWWGYLGTNYATKQGLQIQFVKNMIDYIVANH